MGGEVLAQLPGGSCGCHILGDAEGWVRWGPGQPKLRGG